MKKFRLFTSVLLLSTCLVGCDDVQEQPVDVTTIEKTKMNYTYMDYANNYYKASSAIPNVGEPNILVLPVYFYDSTNFIPTDKKEAVREDIERCFNGTKEEVGFESVTSYYSTLSSNKCNLKCKVADWIDLSVSYENYVIEEDETIDLVISVTNQYFATSGEERSKYDLDKNGYLDGVIVIYAIPDTDSIRKQYYSNLWAYTNWTTQKPNVENPTVCNFFWASYDFMYTSEVANSRVGTAYACGDDSNGKASLDTHVFIHEMGHMFGLYDYYDYSYQYSPAGGFSMQDYNVASHDPFSVLSLGWCDPYIPTESCTIKLNTFQSSREVILLSNSWNSLNSPFDEYFLIELYSPDGLNKFDHENQYFADNRSKKRPVGPDEIGVRLWHVDARLISYPYLKDASKMTVDPNAEGKVVHAMSNTYSGNSYGRGYISPLGSSYADYNILQLIRNEETETYRTRNAFDKFSLFNDGSSFTMNKFSKQFVNKSRLNDPNKVLGWAFDVKIEGEQALITLTRRM